MLTCSQPFHRGMTHKIASSTPSVMGIHFGVFPAVFVQKAVFQRRAPFPTLKHSLAQRDQERSFMKTIRRLSRELLLGRIKLLSFEGPGVRKRFVDRPTCRQTLLPCNFLFVSTPSTARCLRLNHAGSCHTLQRHETSSSASQSSSTASVSAMTQSLWSISSESSTS